MKVLVAGDFCPQYKLAEIVNQSGYEQMFGGVKDIISSADYAIVNFECPVTTGGEQRIRKCGPHLRCSPNGVDAVRWAGFDCVTLANNHFFDYGEKGVQHTLDACQKRGIDVVGGGRNLQEASKTLYKKINGKTLSIINCCEHEFSIATHKKGGSNPIDPIRQFYAIKEARSKADFVLVIVHGGHEHYQLPSTRMQDWYRFFVDAGADAVVNHHQHCFSGMEVYKEKPIFYGLGNFLFDTQNSNLSATWHDGYMVSLSFDANKVGYEIVPYRQCDGALSVQLLTSTDKRVSFLSQFRELSNIISDRTILERHQSEYYAQSAKGRLSAFEPYRGRLLRAAFHRGILPSFLRGKGLTSMIDYLQCESHCDIVQYAMNKKLNQK